jgi:hypothetical protein
MDVVFMRDDKAANSCGVSQIYDRKAELDHLPNACIVESSTPAAVAS